MNPWDILAWVAAICIAVVVVVLTVTVIVGAVKGAFTPKRKDTRIL